MGTKFIIGCVMAALGGCAFPASQEEISSATTDIVRCLEKAVAELDDGKTDPQTTAIAVHLQCSSAFTAKNNLLVREYGNSQKPRLLAGASERDRDLATAVIIKYRASRR